MALALVVTGPATAGEDLGASLCRTLSRAVETAAPKGEPVFLVSYQPGDAESEVPEALRNTAFSYDNALAATALAGCGNLSAARQIGEAFLTAIDGDRTFNDGRVRNAYRAGIVKDKTVLLPGWWDAEANHWAEDRYQVGSATGNVAWVGLALSTLYDATHDPRYRSGAERLAAWIRREATSPQGQGFTGGRDGYDPAQISLTWASTEHNIDIAALGRRLGGSADMAMAASARAFIDAAFDGGAGCFRMGTDPQGHRRGLEALALDTQLWPLLGIADPPRPWHRALDCATTRLGVPGGFDFNDDRDGLWVEGTAQAALTFRAVGDTARVAPLLATLAAQRAPSGWLYATRDAQVTTGLRIGPQSTRDDFLYYRRPHLGATAWAALAATGRNPFTGGPAT